MDHHTLPLEDTPLVDSVVKIIDHRPRDPAWPWSDKRVNIQTVGSCATLVGGDIIENRPEMLDLQISNLLRGKLFNSITAFP